MFDDKAILAFVLNLIVIFFCFSAYPFLNFIIIEGNIKIYKEARDMQEVSPEDILGKWFNTYAISINTIPFLITIFYPQIANVLGFIGSIFGFFILYFFPVITYLKMLKNELIETENKSDEYLNQSS